MLVERFPLTELMSCNWRCSVHQTNILSFWKLQDIYSVNLTSAFMWQRRFNIFCKDSLISVNLPYILRSTVCKQMDQIWEKSHFQVKWCSLLKLNNFLCSTPSAGPKSLKNNLVLCSTCKQYFYSFDFKCNSSKADKKLESCFTVESAAVWKKDLSHDN